MFGKVCPLPEFESALATAGAQNFSLGGSGNFSSGVFSVAFEFIWVDPCPAGQFPGVDPCSYQEYWVGNFSTLDTSGPYSQVGPAIYNGPASSPSVPVGGSTPAPTSNGWVIACFLWGAGAAVVAAAVGLDRRRGRPPRTTGPPSSSVT